MRKVLAILLLTFFVASVSASSIASPAATVNLIRNKAITEQELNETVEAYRAMGIDIKPSEVLQTMINDEVFLQGAERDGVTISDRTLDLMYNQVYQNAKQQAASVGYNLTQEEFDGQVVESFGSVEEYKELLKNQQILNTYLMQEKGDELSKVEGPTDSEINSFYRQNQQQFFQPECSRIAQIFISKETEGALAKITEASEKIKKGELTFEAAVPLYTEDTQSIATAGDIGWLAVNNTAVRNSWGDSIVDEILSMSPGEVSGVIESNVGYHIVKVSVHLDAKLLTLNDPVSPEASETVYDYIYSGLYQQKLQIRMAELVNEIVADLRSEARIRILYRGE